MCGFKFQYYFFNKNLTIFNILVLFIFLGWPFTVVVLISFKQSPFSSNSLIKIGNDLYFSIIARAVTELTPGI